MSLCKTLVIKHLPETLNRKDREEFLKYFGAKEVKFLSSDRNRYNVAFARFENEIIAENVLHRLHQISVLGRCLSVEYAKNEGSGFEEKQISESIQAKSRPSEEEHNEFLERLSSWHSELNFKEPVPCHLKYQYPPPDTQILTNLIKALITVPKFYTQVLHLMNKMNLPCPFGRDILPDVDFSVLSLLGNIEIDTTMEEEVGTLEKKETSSESELTSDEEFKGLKNAVSVQKNKPLQKPKIRVARVAKPETPTRSRKREKVKLEDVFEPHLDDKEPKKIKLNYNVAVSDQVPASPAPHTGEAGETSSGFGFMHPVKSTHTFSDEAKDSRDEREEERLQKEKIICITEAELALNRIPEKDRSILPVFKNYAEGAPTCRLYIKNLAKTVSDADLRFIFSRYIPDEPVADEPNLFDIRVMQEGRMKGQAFVTLQSVELAQQALRETNGYILKDKPLVVQFARSSTNVK